MYPPEFLIELFYFVNFLPFSNAVLWLIFKSTLTAGAIAVYANVKHATTSFSFGTLFYLPGIFWSSLPAIVYAITERDIPESAAMELPVLYTLVSLCFDVKLTKKGLEPTPKDCLRKYITVFLGFGKYKQITK